MSLRVSTTYQHRQENAQIHGQVTVSIYVMLDWPLNRKCTWHSQKEFFNQTLIRRPLYSFPIMQQHRLGGYVIVRQSVGAHEGGHNWVYLRRHAENVLFAANLPWPLWLPLSKVISEDHQQVLKTYIASLFPGAQTVQDIFSTENGRIGARVEMRDTKALDAVLSQPKDHVYLPACERMRRIDDCAVDGTGTLTRWLRDYEAERDEKSVLAWSEAAMSTYETRERLTAEAKAKRERTGAKPDKDGFVTVTNGAPQMKLEDARALASQQSVRPSKMQRRQKQNAIIKVSKGIQKTGLYRWEREKVGALVQLRNKFRDDQKRVAAICKLKPFHASGKADLSKAGGNSHGTEKS